MTRSILFITALGAALVVVVLVMMNRGEGVTPLMKAAKSGDAPEIKRLVAQGAEVDQQSRFGWTALMFAAWQGHADAVAALLAAGADPNVASGGVPSGFETVLGHPPSSALQEAVRNDHFQIATMLIRAGAQIDGAAAALAGRGGDVEFLEYLKTQGATWNVSSKNAFYATPLCAAASSGKLPAVRWLIQQGADPNLVAVGQTALKGAIEEDELEVVEYLLQHGADPNLVYGTTDAAALFTAVTKYTDDRAYPANLAIIRLLLQHGADPRHRAFDGQDTALAFIKSQRANTKKYLAEAPTEEARDSIRASLAHKDAVIELLEREEEEQLDRD